MNRKSLNALRALPALMLAVVAAACASMGRPDGGPRDVTPPRYTYSNPPMGSVNFKGNKLRVYFDENVQIKDAMSKVVVSPAQITTPSVSSNGHWVQVEFRDSMLPNTTYTVDFSDAISDLNEGNTLDGFATDFSTGPTIDTLRISGMVFQASNLEPAQGMVVGVYSNLSDTTITTLPFERITKTNQYGRFTIRNLKPGTYRIFALNDLNRDYHWDRSEDVAFYDTLITPYTRPITVNDTLAASDGSDSIVSRPATAYYPDDIILTWFNENYKSQYLVKNERPERRKINFEFGAPSDTFPVMRIVGTERDGEMSDSWALMTSSATRDTLSYWITDTLVSGLDSLTVSLTYQRTDTLDRLSWTTDTLRLFLRGSNTRKAEAKRAKEEAEKRRKALEKGDTLPEPAAPKLGVNISTGTQDVHLPIPVTFGEPVTEIDTTAVSLEIQVDSVWQPAGHPRLMMPNPLYPMSMLIEHEWEPGAEYKLKIDSAAFTGVFGTVNDSVVKNFKVHGMEDYSTIRFNVTPVLADTVQSVIVELLNKSDAVIGRQKVSGGTALFEYLPPSTYYARAFIDRNGNGLYDSGKLLDSIQPEEVFYYPKRLNLKKNWDIEQTWDLYEQPLDLQKPNEIKKNKPAKKRGELPEDTPSDEDEEDEDYGFGQDPFAPGGGNRYGRGDRNNLNRNNARGFNNFRNDR